MAHKRVCAGLDCGKVFDDAGRHRLCGACRYRRRCELAAPCAVEGCSKPGVKCGLCQGHYGRWKRWGDPLGSRPLFKRFCEVEGCDRRHFGRGLCQRHYRAAFPEKADQPWNERRKANYQKRRALKRTEDAERILLSEVRERDGHRCGLCGKRVGSKSYPHPLSASLDHVLPLSEGGLHVLANVQLAHLRCNLEKGARGNDQLRLVG